MMLRSLLASSSFLLVCLVLAECGGGEASEGPAEVTVLAAASLAEPFEDLAAEIEADHPDLTVKYSFGPSSGLVEQVINGAPADVLATADELTMGDAADAGAVNGEPQLFARNTLVLVTPPDNPGVVSGLADLERKELRIALCEPQVPCGHAAAELLKRANVVAEPDTLATDVKDATSLVTLGEVDAALVYRTDARAEGDDVRVIEVPEAADVVNDYLVAELADAPHPKAARIVIEAIRGPAGQRALDDAGFLMP